MARKIYITKKQFLINYFFLLVNVSSVNFLCSFLLTTNVVVHTLRFDMLIVYVDSYEPITS